MEEGLATTYQQQVQGLSELPQGDSNAKILEWFKNTTNSCELN